MQRFFSQLFRMILNAQAAVFEGVAFDPDAAEVEIWVRRRSNAKPRCPDCGRVLGGNITRHRRRWRHLDMIKAKCFLSSSVREGYCTKHGRRVESVPWAFPAARSTKLFDYDVALLAQTADKTAATRRYGVSWRTVSRIVDRVVEAELPNDRFADLTQIGVDETSYKRGHRYLTVVVNLASGRVIWLGDGKSADTLGAFFDELGPARCAQITAVSMDMSAAYLKAAEEYVPQADIVYDKFHVVKLLMEAIDEARRDEVRDIKDPEARKTLKGTRFALLRNPKHLSDADKEVIAMIYKKNRRLARAYELRVEIEGLWDLKDTEEARAYIMRWTRSMLLSRQESLRRFAKTLREHIEGVLGHFKWGITNAKLEGTNNKIKLAIHRAFGFHSVSALMAMVYLYCGGIDLSSGPWI